MLTTKIRTTIVALAATFSVAVAASPMVAAAQAEDSGGGYQRTMQEYCKEMHDDFESEVADFVNAFHAGDGKAASDALDLATSSYQQAQAHDCDWTVEAAPPRWPIHRIPTGLPVSRVGVS